MKKQNNKFYKESIVISCPVSAAFEYLDNIGNTGMHMTEKSAMMGGSKMQLQQMTANATGLNSRFRWTGKIMGIKMDFTICVTQWIQDVQKTWETIGPAKMIILTWYRMHLHISSTGNNTIAELSIEYSLSDHWFWNLISRVLAPIYARWCVRNMLMDAKKHLESNATS